MHPALVFSLGSRYLAITSYRAFAVLAALATVGLGLAIATRRGLPRGRASACLLAMAAATPVGARLFHAAINAGIYLEEPAQLWSLGLGDFSMAGGLLLAAATGLIACRHLSLEVTRLADAVAPALGVGIALMRIGCFLAGCCFGKATDLPWGVTFPVGSNAHIHQLSQGIGLFSASVLPVHPTQAYELTAALIGAALAGWLLHRRAVDGTAFLVFTLWYSSFRWANHYLRAQPATLTIPVWFYPAFYAAVIGICLWLLFRRYPRPALMAVRTALASEPAGEGPAR